MTRDLIKQDINFLEFPLWFQNKHLADKSENGFVWRDIDGFIYRASYKPPVHTDLIVLLAILQRSQQLNWEKEIVFSRYELLRDCGFGTTQGTYWYKRVKESLERWIHVVVTFEGTFYDKPGHTEMQFHILDDWRFEEETKKLTLRISPLWLERIQHSTYFKMLDFKHLKALRSPLATRLYEILVKTFEGRPTWSCGAKKLAGKIPMKEQYPADIIPKIKTAVNRINEKTDLQIKLTVRRPERGKAIFDFEKLEPLASEEASAKPQIIDVPKEALPTYEELISLMPEKEQGKKTLRELLSRKLRKHGADYVRRNILYANKKATTNYRTFLGKALKEDWGAGYIEDLQQAQEQGQRKDSQAELKRLEEQEELQLHKEAHKRLLSMTHDEKKQLEEKARAGLSPDFLKSDLAPSFIQMRMHALLVKIIEAEKN